VRATGEIDISPTGYYSLDLYQTVEQIESDGACTRQPPIPADPKGDPDKRIRIYRVDMKVDLSPGDHPIQFRITSGGRELHPWQFYASSYLTGSFVLYGECGKGFRVGNVNGPPIAMPSHFTNPGALGDRAMFDAEGDPDAGITHLHLSYTCIRAKP
jgi:hypothetical protein